MAEEEQDLTETTFNMMLQELMLIDQHRKQAHTLLLVARYDFNAVFGLYDALRGWYSILRPICNEKDRRDFDAKFDVMEKDIITEFKRVKWKFAKGQTVGMSDGLRHKFVRLLDELYTLKQIHGLGMRKEVSWKRLMGAARDLLKTKGVASDGSDNASPA